MGVNITVIYRRILIRIGSFPFFFGGVGNRGCGSQRRTPRIVPFPRPKPSIRLEVAIALVEDDEARLGSRLEVAKPYCEWTESASLTLMETMAESIFLGLKGFRPSTERVETSIVRYLRSGIEAFQGSERCPNLD